MLSECGGLRLRALATQGAAFVQKYWSLIDTDACAPIIVVYHHSIRCILKHHVDCIGRYMTGHDPQLYRLDGNRAEVVWLPVRREVGG